jgi:UDP-glucose 4-epimerase
MNKVLIVGINNFLAVQIAKLLKPKFEIDGIYNNNRDNIPEEVSTYSILQIDKLKDEYDYVYVISAFVPGKLESDEQKLFDVNVRLIQRLLEQFKRARFILASSVSIHGKQMGVLDESSSSLNVNSYALSKLWAEVLVKKHHSYGILRISSMYGVGMKTSTFLPLIIKSAADKQEITVFGDGSRKQNYIHVRDVAEMFYRTALKDFNFIGLAVSPVSISNFEVAKLINQNLKEVEVKKIGEDQEISYEYNANYTYKMLDFVPTINLKDGIIELIKWIKK